MLRALDKLVNREERDAEVAVAVGLALDARALASLALLSCAALGAERRCAGVELELS
jgi:hypothetical protein